MKEDKFLGMDMAAGEDFSGIFVREEATKIKFSAIGLWWLLMCTAIGSCFLGCTLLVLFIKYFNGGRI